MKIDNYQRRCSAKIIILILTVAFAACNRDVDEFRFSGKVVGAEMCTASMFGYVIDISYPDSVGGTIIVDGTTYNHAVMAYRASRILKKDEVVYGVAYFTKSFAALNCMGLINSDLPEMVLLSVDEDSTSITNK